MNTHKKLFLSDSSLKFIIFTIITFLILISFILGSVIVKAQNGSAHNNETAYYTNVVIGQGDSLWSIASEHMDSAHYDSIYDYMDEIKSLNNMSSDKVYEGEKLLIVYYSDTIL